MKIRIYWKLTAVLCLIILLVLSFVYQYSATHLKNYLEQRIYYNLKRDLLLNKDLLENELKSNISSSDTPALAERMGRSLGLRVTIIAKSGTLTGDSELTKSELAKAENHSTRPEIREAVKNGFGVSRRFSTTKRTDMLYMAAPLGEGGSLGFLRLAMPLSEIELVESKMQHIITFAFLLGLLLTLASGMIISPMISRPLSEMSLVAANMASGDFSKKIYARSRDEIGDLSAALNHMADEINNKISKISSEEAKLKTVVSNMFEGIMLTDNNGEIIMMNPSLRKMFLVDTPVEGKKPIEVMRNNEIQGMVDTIIREHRHMSKEEILTSLPEERSILISGAPVIEHGGIEGVILVFHDITELRRLERIRQDFVANVSHELRTPLANIKGYSETLLNGAIKDEAHAKEFTEIIHKESERLSNIIADLLDIAKIESGKMKMVLMPIDPAPLIKKAIDILKNSATEKSISIECSFQKDSPKILADEGRFMQILINLLDNAVKYTPENGRVTVNSSKKNGFLLIEVSDTGVGIPEKDLPRIFERFYRVDKARSRELGGTGLGLSIAKHIVQAHGGEIMVSSYPGNGSTFSFIIPIAQ